MPQDGDYSSSLHEEYTQTSLPQGFDHTPTDLYAFGNIAGPRPLVKAENTSIGARMELFSKLPALVPLVKRGLHQPAERSAALRIAARLPARQKRALLPDLVSLASFVHGSTREARNIILSLSREWLRENIEKYAEPILQRGDYEEYASLLELYMRIDHDLALRLALRAVAHNDPDIRDVGETFLARLWPFMPRNRASRSGDRPGRGGL